MAFIELKFLILTQIGIDIAIIIVFILLIRRFRHFNRDSPLLGGLRTLESLLTDAHKMSGQFKEQLEEKNRLIKKLDGQLDKKIMSLNLMLNRADTLLSNHSKTGNTIDAPAYHNNQEKEIINLAQKGRDIENIADALSIPKGEVKLVLDLKKKISQLGSTDIVK